MGNEDLATRARRSKIMTCLLRDVDVDVDVDVAVSCFRMRKKDAAKVGVLSGCWCWWEEQALAFFLLRWGRASGGEGGARRCPLRASQRLSEPTPVDQRTPTRRRKTKATAIFHFFFL
jgi:hypothetical protein